MSQAQRSRVAACFAVLHDDAKAAESLTCHATDAMMTGYSFQDT